MMRQITAAQVANAVALAIPQLACTLPRDVWAALEAARAAGDTPAASYALSQLCENARIAKRDGVPICQDTGYVWVCLEIGAQVMVAGDVMSGVNQAVAKAYRECALRKSMVRDALCNRANSNDNTPALTELRVLGEGDPQATRLHIMLKGGGSDNASRVVMLPPGAGRQGIIDEAVACVRAKAANACPPITLGVGIGGSFDKVAGLAKMALMRPLGEPAADEEAAALERDILAAVNATGVGAGGLGGGQTAFAVQVNTAPCHIAALPLALNLGCSALRRVSLDLASAETVEEQLSRLLGCDGECAPDLPQSDGQAVTALSLPLDRQAIAGLRAGERCTLSGPLYTLRDAGHMRLIEELRERGSLPYGLEGQTIFYAGPTPAAAGRPFGAIGPTTASRMDFAAPELYDAGVAASVGKGSRDPKVREACARNGAAYFTAVGGAAAYLAQCVESSTLVAYEDLGTEALRRIEVRDLPVVLAFDAQGGCMGE